MRLPSARGGLKAPSWSNPAVRAAVYQALFLIAALSFLIAAFIDVRANMQARGIPTGFGFLNDIAGFDINLTLISYSATSTYARAFLVGLLNTILAGVLGLILATVLGFAVGIARLSQNWLMRQLASVYVEGLRNVPLLLQLLFWYNAVLKPLPAPRASLALPLGISLNNRGLYLPEPMLGPGAAPVFVALFLGLAGAVLFLKHGKQAPLARAGLAALILLVPPTVASFIAGVPVSFAYPRLETFNVTGGLRLLPELVALVLGLGLYTAAFIAEIVRAGIQSVPKGQVEAGEALGLSRGMAMRFIIVPQAMRVIIPLLTSQYLNLIKNSSLAVFVGYPDLVQVFAGTVLNQTGAAVQVIFITMAVYLSISLFTSLAMNFYNRRIARDH
jgi:general L-amino acid transport system permease protein